MYLGGAKMLEIYVICIAFQIVLVQDTCDGAIPWVMDWRREVRIVRELLQKLQKYRSLGLDLQVCCPLGQHVN